MPFVTSKDGTQIAYDKLGNGATLIFVAGATCYRQFPPVAATAEALAEHFTVYNYDRRGRGDSTETPPFAVEREIEDIDALIDDAGGTAFLFGHSSGAALGLESALKLGTKVSKLAVYEPPYCADEKACDESAEFDKQLGALLAKGKRSQTMEFFMTGVGIPAEVVDGMKLSPDWSKFEAMAHTLLYDSAVANRRVPTTRAAKVSVPTLVMAGEETYDFLRDIASELARAIPHAELKIMQGQEHNPNPQTIAATLADFWNNGN